VRSLISRVNRHRTETMEVRRGGGPPHGGLTLPARISLAHFSVSTLIRIANSSGVVPTASKPSGAKRSCISGIAMILTISRLSVVTISFGVLAGTRTPTQLSASISG